MKKLFFFGFIATMVSCTSNHEKKETVPTATDAFGALKEEIKRYPDSLLLHEMLIQQYRDSGYYDSAINMADRVLQKDSTIARFWYIKGTLQIENEDTLGGIKSYEQAANLYPSEKNLAELGNIYAITGNKKAIAVADLLSKNPELKIQRNPYFIKGIYYNAIGDNIAAIPFFDKCLAISYTDMEAYLAKAISLSDMQKNTEALAVLDKALTLQNNFEVGYYYKGKTLEKLNRKDEAIEAYQQALLYDKNYTEAKEALNRLGAK